MKNPFIRRTLLLGAALFAAWLTATAQNWLTLPPGVQNHYVQIGDVDVSGTQLTVEALISVTDTLWGPGENVVSKHHSPENINYLLREISFEIRTTQGFLFLSNPVQLCPDSIYHIAGTYDGDTVRYFLNGIMVNAAAHSGGLYTNNLNTAIGNRASQGNEQFKGFIDEVRIWEVARSDSALYADMYDLPNPENEPGLLAYYKFEGNYQNLQGNNLFDGTPIGTDLAMGPNPNFTGSVSTDTNCFLSVSVADHTSPVQLQVYPNPSSGRFTLESTQAGKPLGHVRVTDATGRLWIEQQVLTDQATFDLDAPAGVYFLFCGFEERSHTQLVILR